MNNEPTLTASCKMSSTGRYYIGFVLELPGVMSQGKTIDELLDNLRDASRLMLSYHKRSSAARINEMWRGQKFEEVKFQLAV